MAGVDVGTAYLTIVPSAKGFAGKLQGELGSGMASAGSKAGSAASKGFGSSFKAGVGSAAKAGALVLAGAAALGIGFVKSSIAEAREAQKVGALTAQVIKTTGGAAKITAGQVGDLATAISNKTGIDDEAIQAGANMLLTFKNIRNEAGKGNDIFNQSTGILTDLATAMGSDPQKAAIQLGKALNDPIKGVAALGRVGVTFTAGQKKTIKSLVEGGKTAEAQKIILKELGSEFGGAAEASATAGEKMSTAFGNFKEGIGTSLLPVLDKVEGFISTKLLPGIQGVIDILFKGDFTKGFAKAFNISEDSRIVDFLFRLREGFFAVAGFIRNDALPVVQRFVGWIANDLWPALKEGYQTILPALKQAFSIVASAFKGTGDSGASFKDTITKIGSFITGTLIPVIAKVATVVLPLLAAGIRNNIQFIKLLYAAFQTWRSIVSSVIGFVLKKFADLSAMWAGVLRALGKVPGFGWATDAANKLDKAAGKARDVARAIDNIERDVKIKVGFQQTGRIVLPNGERVNLGMRAGGGPVAAGKPYAVGDNPDGSWNRTTELFVPSQSGTIFNQDQLASMRGGGGSSPLSRADLQLLVAAVEAAQVQATISVGSVDRAMGGALR